MSVQTVTDATSYDGLGYSTFGTSSSYRAGPSDYAKFILGFEYTPGRDGKITWAWDSNPTWRLYADAMGVNTETQIDQRLVAEEPLSIVINLAISNKFQTPQWGKLVRVWSGALSACSDHARSLRCFRASFA